MRNILLCLHVCQQIMYCLKGTATLMISMFYQKERYEPWILILASSKSVENGQAMGS